MSTKTKTFEELLIKSAIKNDWLFGHEFIVKLKNDLDDDALKIIEQAADLYASEKIKRAIELAREGEVNETYYRFIPHHTEQEIIDQLFKP